MKTEIVERLKRLDEILKEVIKNHPEFEGQDDIAKDLGYKRSGTISDYKNPNTYNESKFIKFIERLSAKYNVNRNYILWGKETKFLLQKGEVADIPIDMSPQERKSKIQGLEYAKQILEAQIAKLKG